MVDGRGDRGSNTGQAYFADAARAKLVKLLVGKVQEVYFDRRRIGVHGHHIIGQVAVDGRAILWVVMRVLEESHADSHHDRTLDLVAPSQWIQDAAGIDNRHYAADRQPRDL